jgi:hypothetical protein
MDHTQLTKEQVTRLHETLFPTVNLLNRLERRMTRLGFPPNDPLYLAVVKAQSAARDLYQAVRRLSCASGVGRPPRKEGGETGLRVRDSDGITLPPRLQAIGRGGQPAGPGLLQSTFPRRIRSLDLAPRTGSTNPRGLKDSFAIAYRRADK